MRGSRCGPHVPPNKETPLSNQIPEHTIKAFAFWLNPLLSRLMFDVRSLKIGCVKARRIWVSLNLPGAQPKQMYLFMFMLLCGLLFVILLVLVAS